MKILLPSGEATIYVQHGHAEIEVKQPKTRIESAKLRVPPREMIQVRATIIRVRMPDGREFEGKALCKPPDVFVRKTGRILATRRLATILRDETNGVPREDRRILFGAIWR